MFKFIVVFLIFLSGYQNIHACFHAKQNRLLPLGSVNNEIVISRVDIDRYYDNENDVLQWKGVIDIGYWRNNKFEIIKKIDTIKIKTNHYSKIVSENITLTKELQKYYKKSLDEANKIDDFKPAKVLKYIFNKKRSKKLNGFFVKNETLNIGKRKIILEPSIKMATKADLTKIIDLRYFLIDNKKVIVVNLSNNILELTKDTLKKSEANFKSLETALSYFNIPSHGVNQMYIILEEKNYNKSKTKMINLRKKLYRKYRKIKKMGEKEKFLDSVVEIFSNNLLNEIIPYWYGTKYDFNGHTEIPNKGVIACGYFVSTTLKDMGLNINRYKLAQQNPEYEVRTISENILSFKMDDFIKISELLNKIPDGLYYVGLDTHVGYLYSNNKKYYFIHSNNLEDRVMREDAEKSEAFISDIYYFSKIDRNLMLNWIKNKKIKVKIPTPSE